LFEILYGYGEEDERGVPLLTFNFWIIDQLEHNAKYKIFNLINVWLYKMRKTLLILVDKWNEKVDKWRTVR
jgi:hypothetical protein